MAQMVNNQKNDTNPNLDQLRIQLNELDREMTDLTVRRLKLSEAVYRAKQNTGHPIYDAVQEKAKLDRIETMVEADYRPAAIAMQQTQMRLSRERQYRLRLADQPLWPIGEQIERALPAMPDYKVVAIQGTTSSYGAQAAKVLFPQAALSPNKTFESAGRQVIESMVDVCVLPLENSTAGTVDDVYRLIEHGQLHVVASCDLAIQHCLIGLPGATLGNVHSVISHPQALAQCSTMIRGMGWRMIESDNTAFAAERIRKENDPGIAAIASEAAARQFDLQIISRDITNDATNQTRFVAISRTAVILPQANLLSLLVRVSHQSGSLMRMLATFSDLGLSLSKIQSLPVPDRPWEYMFYLDVETPVTPEALQALYQLAAEQPMVRFVGWTVEQTSLEQR